MEKEILLEEEKKLEIVIARYKELIEELTREIERLNKGYNQDPRVAASLLSIYRRRLDTLKSTMKRPYFARIDFKSNHGKLDSCYIGKISAMDKNNRFITIDWRAPIASLYYDSNLGQASYESINGTISGELLLKRQYKIENGSLINYQDVSTISDDSILKAYLDVNVENRLRDIVASVQSEQNAAIRYPMNRNLIVQGVAGSGKTTVALHRVAFLVYTYDKTIKPEQYMVIGPNKFFVSYISSVLPDLDVDNVKQLTYPELVKRIIDEDIGFNLSATKLIQSISERKDLSNDRLKTSMAYKRGIDKFMKEFDRTVVSEENFGIRGFPLIRSETIAKVYNSLDRKMYKSVSARVDKTILILSETIKREEETLSSRLTKMLFQRLKMAGNDKDQIEKIKKDYEYAKTEIRNGCNQSLQKYFSRANSRVTSLYADFIKDAELYLAMDPNQLEDLKAQTLKSIKSKTFDFEDLGALLYLKYKLNGMSEFQNYRHIVIDEAQDYGEFDFYALRKMMGHATFSIFGDLSQSIYAYRSVENWQKVITESFGDNCDMKELLKSYRTTTEIMNAANSVTSYIGLNTATPVIRHGREVEYIPFNKDQCEQLMGIIAKYIKNGHKSIAIISKTEQEATNINQMLKQAGLNVDNIVSTDSEYNGGICTIASYLTKGLEFDAAVITDASEKEYSSERPIDMKLLYVAMTRALHELDILYSGTLNKALQGNLPKPPENGNKVKDLHN